MSYKIDKLAVPIKIDMLTPFTLDANKDWGLTAPATLNTDISVGSNDFTIYSGSSYYIEASVTARNANRNGAFTFQIYNQTSSIAIGQDALLNLNGTAASSARQGRRVARALILDSDITSSMVISVRQTSISGSGWEWDYQADGVGYPSVRVWQLPS
jgi:hypothetical protein